MPLDKTNGVISGNDAMTWMNGELLEDIKSIEWRITLEFGDVTFMSDPKTYKKYQGFTGEGTLVFNKMKSRGASLLKDALKSGVMPNVKIVTKLVNASTKRAERAVISGITFNELGSSTEAKTIAEETLPFSFSEIEFPELM